MNYHNAAEPAPGSQSIAQTVPENPNHSQPPTEDQVPSDNTQQQEDPVDIEAMGHSMADNHELSSQQNDQYNVDDDIELSDSMHFTETPRSEITYHAPRIVSEDEIRQFLPLGTYDPFKPSLPKNPREEFFAREAVAFLRYNIRTMEQWNELVDDLLIPFEMIDSYYHRTFNWFAALPLPVQVEVILQRNLGLRPGTRWIIGPFDLLQDSWHARWDRGACVMVRLRYPGSDFVIRGRTVGMFELDANIPVNRDIYLSRRSHYFDPCRPWFDDWQPQPLM